MEIQETGPAALSDGRVFRTERRGDGTARMKLVGLPSADVVDETIRRAVLALLHGRAIRKEDLSAVLDCSRGTVFNKLAASDARPFTASEVARLAAFFDVPITDLYDGLGGRFAADPSTFGPGARVTAPTLGTERYRGRPLLPGQRGLRLLLAG